MADLMSDKIAVDLFVLWASELLTLRSAGDAPKTREEMRNLGIIKNGAVAARDGRIVFVGTSEDFMNRVISGGIRLLPDAVEISARDKVVMPGFVDCHTHFVFAGSREEEFAQKVQGVPYEDILKSGGGILSTVHQTRKADDSQLLLSARKRLKSALSCGTTTIEIKSGYGLSKDSEIRLLRMIKLLQRDSVIDIVPTFLGAHAFPKEIGREDYVAEVIDTLDEVARDKLAEYCDVFCDYIAFSADETRRILEKARAVGLKVKVHAGQFRDIGGTRIGLDFGATSIDHLDCISAKDAREMARKKVPGVLLPGASFHLMARRYAPARKLIDLGVPIAIATDFNPGSSPTLSMQMIMALAYRYMEMTPEELIIASTINAAYALDRGHEIGSLEVGKKADILILDIANYKHLPYWFGPNAIEVETVVKNGKVVARHS